jgi:hypothetical protein
VGPDGVSKYYRAPCGAGVQIAGACRSIHMVQPNNCLHPTRDTLPVINFCGAGERVMPDVRCSPHCPA